MPLAEGRGPEPTTMLKIALVKSDGERATLRLEGRIIGPWVGELGRSCERLLGSGASLTLDLAGVDFADLNGVRLLRDLSDREVGLVNLTMFLSEQLRAEERPCTR
jgi:hypothetical protein